MIVVKGLKMVKCKKPESLLAFCIYKFKFNYLTAPGVV